MTGWAFLLLGLVVVLVWRVGAGRRKVAQRPEPPALTVVRDDSRPAAGPRYRFPGSGGAM